MNLEDLWPNLDYSAFNDAIEAWGNEAQFLMMVEECGELISAIMQTYRDREDADLVGELADVFIMASQLSLMLGPPNVAMAVKQKMLKLERKTSASRGL